MNTVALSLLECRVALYPADNSDAPVVAEAVWMGVEAENLVARDRWLKVETRPTGRRYPKRHPILPQYEVSLARVWALQLLAGVGGGRATANQFEPDEGRYVLDAVWEEEDAVGLRLWHRRTFYGVTISDRGLESREVDTGHTDNQVYEAEYMVPDGGLLAAGEHVPAMAPGLPQFVKWQGADGRSQILFRYDPVTQAFTEATPGIAGGKVSLGEDADGLKIVFEGAAQPALLVGADGSVKVSGDVTEGVPAPSALQSTPRLEFFSGKQRVASLSAVSGLFLSAMEETDAMAVDDLGFGLAVGGQVRASLNPTRMLVSAGVRAGRPGLTADSDKVSVDSDRVSADATVASE